MKAYIVLMLGFCLLITSASPKPSPAPSAKPRAEKPESYEDKEKDKNWITVKGTTFDFDETLLQGHFRQPNGLMLQGRKTQEKKQMVTLRKDFKTNIINSRSAVRSISP